jgi:hypothetical protein
MSRAILRVSFGRAIGSETRQRHLEILDLECDLARVDGRIFGEPIAPVFANARIRTPIPLRATPHEGTKGFPLRPVVADPVSEPGVLGLASVPVSRRLARQPRALILEVLRMESS